LERPGKLLIDEDLRRVMREATRGSRLRRATSELVTPRVTMAFPSRDQEDGSRQADLTATAESVVLSMAAALASVGSLSVRAGDLVPGPGLEMRVNLYRIQGPPESRRHINWHVVNRDSFHTPRPSAAPPRRLNPPDAQGRK
jgi:hypothetical protein